MYMQFVMIRPHGDGDSQLLVLTSMLDMYACYYYQYTI